MNTKPDDTLLARWLDDELEGDELAAVEAWVATRPEHAAAREENRRWKAWLTRAVPAAEEPPYPDFFNTRIARAIEVATPAVPAGQAPRLAMWRRLLLPAGALAGMALAFLAGTRTRPAETEFDFASAPRAIPVGPVVYTPEKGVKAEWIESEAATVIVIHGMEAIPDSTDFSRTAADPRPREIDRTAGLEPNSPGTPESGS